MSKQNNTKVINFGDREWPSLSVDGKVPTKAFLEACETIVTFFEQLGKLFTPVRKDIEGNVNKLRTKYLTNPVAFEFIHDMIISEVGSPSASSTESLLWLKRGLHFTFCFLRSIVQDYEKSVREESLCVNLEVAYEVTLQEYHNWVIRKFFSACINSRMCPQRTELMKTLTGKQDDEVDGMHHANVTIPKLALFVKGLEINLASIFELYATNGLDTRTSL